MTQFKRVPGKPYALLLEQNPPRKRRRHLWSSRRLLPVEVAHILGNRTNRRMSSTQKMQARFRRFTTKPNWEGVRLSQKGAALAMIESDKR